MAHFFVSLLGGAYCLVEEESLLTLEDRICVASDNDEPFVQLVRPDGRKVLLAPDNVTLIQPPAPPIHKENIA